MFGLQKNELEKIDNCPIEQPVWYDEEKGPVYHHDIAKSPEDLDDALWKCKLCGAWVEFDKYFWLGSVCKKHDDMFMEQDYDEDVWIDIYNDIMYIDSDNSIEYMEDVGYYSDSNEKWDDFDENDQDNEWMCIMCGDYVKPMEYNHNSACCKSH